MKEWNYVFMSHLNHMNGDTHIQDDTSRMFPETGSVIRQSDFGKGPFVIILFSVTIFSSYLTGIK